MQAWLERLWDIVLDPNERSEILKLLESKTSQSTKYIRVHPHRLAGHDFRQVFKEAGMLLGEAYAHSPNSFVVQNFQERHWDSSPLLGANLGFFQEPMATEVVESLGVEAGDRVLETCAAPGAKTVHILEELQGQGLLYSYEVDRLRFGRLDLLAARSGWRPHRIFCEPFDRVHGLKSFHKIICDVPCTSESFFFKRKDTRSDVSLYEVEKLQKLQRNIVGRALEFLSPGGRLVYATCTYNRFENEDNREWILKQDASLQVTKEVRRFPHREGVPGGYYVVFEKKGERENPLKPLELEVPFRSEYQEAMFVYSELPKVECDLNQAQKYLRGEAFPGDFAERGWVRLAWKGFVIGLGKAVEGRVNNLLPKGLRALR